MRSVISKRRRLSFDSMEARELPSGGISGKLPANQVGPLTPVTQLTGTYNGQTGGLYGDGANDPPASQQAALQAADTRIFARDSSGAASPGGKIGVLAIGQSTTQLEFSVFRKVAGQDGTRDPHLVFVNGGQDGVILQNWATSASPWKTAIRQAAAAGISAKQVQVVWIDSAQIYEWRYGDFNARTDHYAALMASVVRTAKRDFPNLQIAYISSRIYGGYGPQGADPEPYAYESAFGVRKTVLDQIHGDPGLNDDPGKGQVVAPVVAWGPYFWANGTTPRADGFSWRRSDFVSDGIHPSNSGRLKAAKLLQNFFQTNASAKSWYLRP